MIPGTLTDSEIRTAEPHKEMDVRLKRAEALEREPASAKQFLQSVVETLEATNEELQSANEELMGLRERSL